MTRQILLLVGLVIACDARDDSEPAPPPPPPPPTAIVHDLERPLSDADIESYLAFVEAIDRDRGSSAVPADRRRLVVVSRRVQAQIWRWFVAAMERDPRVSPAARRQLGRLDTSRPLTRADAELLARHRARFEKQVEELVGNARELTRELDGSASGSASPSDERPEPR